MTDVSFFQNAWVVTDLSSAIDGWLEAGVGPFFVISRPTVTGHLYRGEPIDLEFSVAIAQSGGVQIELIEQHNLIASHYHDSVPQGSSGFHHMGRFSNNFDSDCQRFIRNGVQVAAEGTSGKMRFAYFDTRPSLGFMTEVVEDDDDIKELFGIVSAAASSWDGITNPVRRLP